MKRVLVIGSEGYVGSQLVANISGEVNVVTCDLKTGMDYLDMQTSVLAAFDEILFFAGTSNVADAKMEPLRAIAENVVFPLSLLERIKPHTRLIYASTGSLLSKRDTSPSVIADEQRENAYDASKLSFDLAAKYMGKRVVGLRMGTVSGWSPRMRWHLIFNAMNRSAIEQGVVRVTNPSAMRSILFHDDLADRILEIMDDDQVQGLIPVASYSLTIGELAHEVAHAHKVPVAFGEDDGTYSFSLPTIPQLFSLAERCEHFKRAYETNY